MANPGEAPTLLRALSPDAGGPKAEADPPKAAEPAEPPSPESDSAGVSEDGVVPPDPPVSVTQVLALSRPERRALLLALVLTLGSEGCALLSPLLLAKAYDAVVDPALEPSDKHTVIGRQMVQVLALHTLGCLLGFLKGSLYGVCGERVVARLRTRLFASILRQEVAFFDQRKTGELVSRLGTDAQSVQEATTSSLTEMVTGLIKTGFALALMVSISWELTLVVLGAAVSLCLLCVPFGSWIGRVSKEYQDALGQASTASTEALLNVRTVVGFGAEALEGRKYTKAIGDAKRWWPAKGPSTFRKGVVKAVGGAAFGTFIFLAGFGAMYASLWQGFLLVTDGKLTLGDLTAFQSYIFSIGFGLASLGGNCVKVLTAKGASQRVLALLHRQPLLACSGEVEPTAAGDVLFEDVQFHYPGRKQLVLSGFSLHVPANSSTALVGASGSGKSTVLGLLQRFYAPQGGRVLLDGGDVQDLKTSWLRAQVAAVQQEPVLFGASLRDNVAYALHARGLAVEDKQVEHCCTEANAHAFIQDFPDKYATLVGERGVKLSGGQKQRVALARAFLAAPRVLLLDEATSALDAESEHLVQEAIERLMRGRTTLVVAHRLSTVRGCAQIAVVDAHQVNDVGTHTELLARCPKYQELVQRQAQ